MSLVHVVGSVWFTAVHEAKVPLVKPNSEYCNKYFGTSLDLLA